jgi:cytochrome b6-f complex iron-sulfur subunit
VFDAPGDRLRCPCHFASFAPTGEVLSHPAPTALAPLPRLEVREVNGMIEVFAPAEPT